MRRLFQARPGEQPLPFRVLFAFIALVLSFTFSIMALAGLVVQNRERINDIGRVEEAACNLRADERHRVPRDVARLRRSEAFLRAHPDGIPGIPRELLLQSVQDQRQDLADRRRFVASLRPLRCE